MHIYVYDRLILGYLYEHSDFSYDRLSQLLNCSKVFIDERLQQLRANEYIVITQNHIRLTKKGEKEKSDYPEAHPYDIHTHFEWDVLYIPDEFRLND
jgi:Mn-dependent DtxR family transcriptional regulator